MTGISIKNLKVSYSGTEVIHNVSVDIPEKKLTTIIGPSGCGKTTMLKSLNRLVDLNEDIRVKGKVLIAGKDIYAPKADVLELRKKVGFLSQNPCPLPMSIYSNVAFGPRIHKMSREKILRQISPYLKKMGFTGTSDPKLKGKNEMDLLVECYLRVGDLWEEVKHRLHSPAAKLSIGQQQRLALARTLAIEPEVILADEPTSALDPISAQLVENEFNELKKKYTIVVVTHTLRQAKRMADNVIFMYLGNMIEHGPAKMMFNKPKNVKTRSYVKGEIVT